MAFVACSEETVPLSFVLSSLFAPDVLHISLLPKSFTLFFPHYLISILISISIGGDENDDDDDDIFMFFSLLNHFCVFKLVF